MRSGLAKGAGLGASSHGAGTAKAYEIGPQEGVVSSLVMMLVGIITVIDAHLSAIYCGNSSYLGNSIYGGNSIY
ncbi:LrgB family protein [Yersinia bercovieri ATCC 43970]|uniref:LrgB family protein n=1 Tax=Yersinia bercovieri ATCC 43970 TaxID=349968 RepID=A0ABM9Y342_YERBE|nr:LrgB family protein [Yersinia bercovieri ATCC 43970]